MSEWKVRDIEFNLIPEMKRNIRNLEEEIKELREKVTNQQINNMALAERIYKLEGTPQPTNDAEINRIVDEVIKEDHDRDVLG